MKFRTKSFLAESRDSRRFFNNKSGVQIRFQALFGQKVKGRIWFFKMDTRVMTSLEKSDYERFPLGFSYFAVQLSTEL